MSRQHQAPWATPRQAAGQEGARTLFPFPQGGAGAPRGRRGAPGRLKTWGGRILITELAHGLPFAGPLGPRQTKNTHPEAAPAGRSPGLLGLHTRRGHPKLLGAPSRLPAPLQRGI